MLIGAFMWALSYGPPSFGRDCRLGLALRRQELLRFAWSHAPLPSRGHRLAIDIVPHTSQHILSYLSHFSVMLRALCSRTYLSASSRLSILRGVSEAERMPRLGSPRTYSLGRIPKSARVVITVNKTV